MIGSYVMIALMTLIRKQKDCEWNYAVGTRVMVPEAVSDAA